jgi:L-histidine N-alpha-methyltransferase
VISPTSRDRRAVRPHDLVDPEDPSPPGTVRFSLHVTEADLQESLRRDVRVGLVGVPKQLPPRWLYDPVGCELFDRITRLAEYYPTRREQQILDRHGRDVAVLSGADTLVELGSGLSDKSLVLLDALAAAGTLRRFAPFDVAAGALAEAARRAVDRYPAISVDAVVGDFTEHLEHLPGGGRRLIAFLGGTIGNLDPTGRADLLAGLVRGMRPGDTFLVGTDLVKDRRRLVRAYDDSEGVTAAFNKNVLEVLNHHLRATFRPELFEHEAVYDEREQRIEMHLVSRRDQEVHIADLGMQVDLRAGEYILTEISTKFTAAQVAAELTAAGMEPVASWTDPAGDFALTLATIGE